VTAKLQKKLEFAIMFASINLSEKYTHIKIKKRMSNTAHPLLKTQIMIKSYFFN